jgi:hypothetical protein
MRGSRGEDWRERWSEGVEGGMERESEGSRHSHFFFTFNAYTEAV